MTVGDRVLATGWGGHPPQGPRAWPATSGAHPDWFGPGGGRATGGPGAIQYAGAVGGIATEGLLQTFLPTGGSDLAQKSWLTRIAGGLAGARPQIPNAAGKSTTKSGGAGSQALPPGGNTVNNQQGDTHSNVHNGDINITAPSGDAKDISAETV
jgi:hypothetical protein